MWIILFLNFLCLSRQGKFFYYPFSTQNPVRRKCFMIYFKNITKVFQTKAKETIALDDVSLHVKKGTIFGVIGYSGAGKSTLVRMANLLEQPTAGQVFFNGAELTK